MTQGRDAYTPEIVELVLRRLAEGKSIGAACKSAKIDRRTYYNWRTDHPEFIEVADQAIEDGTDAIEDNALNQAKHGAQTLMTLILKARRPEKYRERSDVQLTGAEGKPFTINLVQSTKGPE